MTEAPTSAAAHRHPVLLHGFTGAADAWTPIVDGLTARGLVPVLVDLPGHGRWIGRREPDHFTLTSTLGLVAEAGRWPDDLVGYSMGARIALHFAVTHPDRVRRLVLESGSPGLDDEVERDARVEADGALAERILRGGVDGFVLEWETLPLFASQVRLPADVRERQRARRRANDPRSLAMSLLGLGTGALPSLWGRLAEVRAPTLLVVGAEDRKFVEIARAMADRLPDAQVVEIAEAGHAVHLERPDAWAEVVGSFLAG